MGVRIPAMILMYYSTLKSVITMYVSYEIYFMNYLLYMFLTAQVIDNLWYSTDAVHNKYIIIINSDTGRRTAYAVLQLDNTLLVLGIVLVA